VPRAIRLNMFRLRCTTDTQARLKNGPQDDRRGQSEFNPVGYARREKIVQKTCNVRTSPTQNRRVMFTSSRRRVDRLQCHPANRAIARPHRPLLRLIRRKTPARPPNLAGFSF